MTIVIPPSLLEGLDRAPCGRRVAVLLRHSARPPIPQGELGHDLPLTPDGVRVARELGQLLGGRLHGLRSSPIRRCLETCAAITTGAQSPLEAVPDRLLEGPGSFVDRAQEGVATNTFLTVGHEAMLKRTMETRRPLPGFHEPVGAARRTIEAMLSAGESGIHLFCTHDFVITLTASMAFDEVLGRPDWPRFLEGLVAWNDDDGVPRVFYRGRERRVAWSAPTLAS